MELIFSYPRAEALADGLLKDVTPMAQEYGIRYPVALTAAAWEKLVKVPRGVTGQDEEGRLWDILTMFRHAARGTAADRLMFQVLLKYANDRPPLPKTLVSHCGPGDDGEPVITIMLPHED